MDTRSLVLDCALPAVPGESRKAALARAAKNSGLTYARIVAFFYQKGNPPPEAREKLIAAAREKQRIKRAWADLEMDQRLAVMTAEYQRLKADVERLDREIAAARGARDHGGGEAGLGFRPEN